MCKCVNNVKLAITPSLSNNITCLHHNAMLTQMQKVLNHLGLHLNQVQINIILLKTA